MQLCTLEEIKEVFNNKDCFKNEKEFCDYIESNIETFCKEILEVDFEDYKRESSLVNKRFGPNKPRIDFLIKCKDGEYVLVECKHPKNIYRENIGALSQLMNYVLLAERYNKKVKSIWLCTTKMKDDLIEIIE